MSGNAIRVVSVKQTQTIEKNLKTVSKCLEPMVSFQYRHILLRLTSLLALPESTLRSSDVVFLVGLRCCLPFAYGYTFFQIWFCIV